MKGLRREGRNIRNIRKPSDNMYMIHDKYYISLRFQIFQVPLKRVHLFTVIQLTCLICLWVIKSFSATSILFPLMLVVMIGIRKSLDLVFTRRELKILDDVMPEITRRKAEDLRHLELAEVGMFKRFANCCLGGNSGFSSPSSTTK